MSDDDIFVMLQTAPVSVAVMASCTALWFYLWNRSVDVKVFGANYDLIVRDKQHWRMVTSTLSHLDILHLAFNMFSVAQLAWLENDIGSFEYAKASFFLMVFSELLSLLVYYLLLRYAHMEQIRNTYGLGYSGVVFGLFAIAAVKRPSITFFFVPGVFAPFFGLFLTQLLIPNAGFVAHLCGILVGYLLAFGALSWVDGLTLGYLFFWFVVWFVSSVKQTTSFPLPFIELLSSGDDGVRVRSARIVNGRIVYDDGQAADNDRRSPNGGAAAAANGQEGPHSIVDVSYLMQQHQPSSAPGAADGANGASVDHSDNALAADGSIDPPPR